MPEHAFAALSKAAPLQGFHYEQTPLCSNDVLIRVYYCALCHSDVHLIDDDWGISRFPLVPGHEIIGRVEATGTDVDNVQVGTIVGVGWQCGACLECAQCSAGREQLCSRAKRRTCVDQFGGFADTVIADSRFVYPLPTVLCHPAAAPLMCAGITVFAPLLRRNAGPETHVGIIGYGGLGHLALRFAQALGCRISIFEPDASRERDARADGAYYFYSDSLEHLAACGFNPKPDLMLCTVGADLNWHAVLGLVAIGGALCLLGVPSRPLCIPAEALQDEDKSVFGSVVGSPAEMRRMLEFAAEKGIMARVEVLPLEQVNTALDNMRRANVRYRYVLQVAKPDFGN